MRDANKQTKPLELYQDHREALGHHTLLRTTAHGLCPTPPPWTVPPWPLMRLCNLRRKNLGWQVPRLGLALECQVGSIMQFRFGGNFSCGEFMAFLEKPSSNESRQDTTERRTSATGTPGETHGQPQEASVRKGRDSLYHSSVNNEWNVRELSGWSVCLAHWNEGL